MLGRPPQPSRRRQRRRVTFSTTAASIAAELLEARCLLASGVTDVIQSGTGDYIPPQFPTDQHDFHITGISPQPDANGVIEVQPGVTSTNVTLTGYILGPQGTTPADFHGGEQVFIQDAKYQSVYTDLNNETPVIDPTTLRPRIDFTLEVEGLTIQAANTFTYEVSALGQQVPVAGASGTIYVDDIPAVSQKSTTPLAVLFNKPLSGNVFDNLNYSDGAEPNARIAQYPPNATNQNGTETTPAGGTFQLNSDGSFTYTPPLNFPTANQSGADSFSFQVTDGVTSPVTITQAVNVQNDIPQFVSTTGFQFDVNPGGQPQTINPSAISIQDHGDPADQLVFTVVTPPSNGELLLSGQPLPNNTFTQEDVNNGLVAYQQTDLTKATDSLTLTATDSAAPAGNTSAPQVLTIVVGNGVNSPTISTFDTQPSPSSVSPLLTRDNLPTFSGSNAPPNSAIQVSVSANGTVGQTVAAATADSSGNWTASVPASAPVADGTYTFVATASVGGKASVPGPPFGPVTIDTSPPASVSITGVTPGTTTAVSFLTNSQTPTISGTVGTDPNDPATSLTITLQRTDTNQVLAAVHPDANGNWSIPLSGSSRLPTGTTNLLVTASDPAGNTAQATASITVSTVVPVIDPSSITLSNAVLSASDLGPQTTSTSPTIQFNLTAATIPATANILAVVITDTATNATLAQGDVTLTPSGGSGQGAAAPLLQLTNLQPGTHTIQIAVTDAAGNTGSLATAYSFFVYTGATGASPRAPGTPIHSTTYDLGKSLLKNGTLKADGDSTTNIDEFPWTMSFDRTTQTVWVDLRGGDATSGFEGGGDRIMQIDPATNSYKLYDLQSPSLIAQHPDYPLKDIGLKGSGPHGIFFDFESHLTPRVWITQMQQGLLSYIDVAKNQLISYDITAALEKFGLVMGMVGPNPVADTHAVTVDSRGVVWFSDMADGLILEFDPRSGDAINNDTGQLIIHQIPKQFLDDAAKNTRIPGGISGPHGIDVVVDQNTNQATLYITMVGNGHILRLNPDDGTGNGDQWTDYATDTSGVALFASIDDQESVNPAQGDLVDFSDPGANGAPKSEIGELNPSTGMVTTWTIPPMPGSSTPAQPNQTFVDREGNIYYIDRQYGIGRIDASAGTGRVDTPATPTGAVGVTKPVAMTTVNSGVPQDSVALDNPVIYDLGNIPSQPLVVASSGTIANRSTTQGVNQYDLRGTGSNSAGSRGQGPFRGTLSAGGDLYASLTQNNEFTVSVFAETARRQLAVVDDPGTPNAPGTGRMAFQVLRDGSLIMTGRQTPSIGDEQTNLTQLINGPHFLEDVSAVTDQAGNTHVFGRDLNTGGLTEYIYTASTGQWSYEQFAALPSVTLDADPTAFLDSTNGAGAMITTSAGQLLVYYPSLSSSPTDLTTVAPGMLVYSTVGVIEVDNTIYTYGTDQTGAMIEYSYNASTGPSSITAGDVRVLASTTGTPLPPVLQDVEVTADGDVRDVFATDGNSQLIYIQVGPGNQVSGENVTESLYTNPNSQIVGYASYQEPYAGRVYPQLSALVDPVTHELYVYGTNGRDLIEFDRPAGGVWQVDDLTNDVTGYAASGISGAPLVFGAPAAYMTADGSQHVLQIDAGDDVIEYYQLSRGGLFNTQDITLGQLQGGTTPTPTPQTPQTKQTSRIGPHATLLTQDPNDPTGMTYGGIGLLQNPHQRASFRFKATQSGIIQVDLVAPFSVLELDTFNPRESLLERNRHPMLITNSLGQTYYQNQAVLNVVAGKTYYFLVKGTPRPGKPNRPPGFGNFVIQAQYQPVAAAQSIAVATGIKGDLRSRSRRSRPAHRAH